ncbi:MAG: amino acid transporter [Rhizobiales bacterium]|nr:amino acid transporter [Hyphomicrobiales bacterium]
MTSEIIFSNLPIFVTGFLLGASLIIAIGAQNAFVLRMGLLRRHVFWLCLFCALSDAVLIASGVAGLGAFVDKSPDLLKVISIIGALFLFFYAYRALKSALNPQVMEAAKEQAPTLLAAITICFSLTFLNPHVYLDTVVLIGGLSAQYKDTARFIFGAGAVTASFVWFFALGYGARLLTPIFASPKAWQVLDVIIAIVMTGLAFSLLRGAI